MSDPTEPGREHPHTYFVQDRGNLNEMTRLDIQNKMLTTGMGGVLSELADPTVLQRVLDVGCGTGGWLIETAQTYPMIETLVGGDISTKMLAYGRDQVKALGLDERVKFQMMDALRVLEFPPTFFDLVNQRGGVSWLRTWEWTKILLEYQRVARPGGTIRITEGHITVESNSPALTELCNIGLEPFHRSGHLFKASSDGVTSELAHIMTKHGIQDVQTKVHRLVYRTGSAEHRSFYEDMALGFRVALPFYRKWMKVPSNYQEIYERALEEMQRPDFVATWTWVTAWGTRSRDEATIYMRGLR